MKKLAICLHIYYKNQLNEILKYLKNVGEVDYDLYVSMVEEDAFVVDAIKKNVPKAQFFIVENRGYDIGPFIEFLHKINIDDYEYILKLHTKGKKSQNWTRLNGYRIDNALWGKILWDSVLGTENRLTDGLQFLDEHKNVCMLGAKYCITNHKKNYENLLPEVNEVLLKMGKEQVNELSFVAGSLFLVRAFCLKPLLKYQIRDFAITDGRIKEGTLAHVMERVFGVLGQEIAPAKHRYFFFYFLWNACKRFCYQNKVTSKGTKMIKICRIPVYVEK